MVLWLAEKLVIVEREVRLPDDTRTEEERVLYITAPTRRTQLHHAPGIVLALRRIAVI
jgi:hypothetical protein